MTQSLAGAAVGAGGGGDGAVGLVQRGVVRRVVADERRRLGIDQLPETLGEAIELTAESELVLRTLGEHMFNRYVEIKRQEWDDYRVTVTQWELDRYLSIL